MRIASIVLAAGSSLRMGPRNKLLEPVCGEPMVRRVAAIALRSGAEPGVVVTGHEATEVGEALQGLGVTVILNPDYADGLSASLRTGLSALPAGIDSALILLGDMPEVEGSVVSDLMASFTGTSAICVPVRHGRKGSVFAPHYWSRRINDDAWLFRACIYVVLNPVAAGVCRHPSDWPWCSYRRTAEGDPDSYAPGEARLLSMFGRTPREARQCYAKVVDNAVAGILADRSVGPKELWRELRVLERPV